MTISLTKNQKLAYRCLNKPVLFFEPWLSFAYRFFWNFLWFHLGAGLALALLFKDKLYIGTLIGISVNIFIGLIFGVLALIKPSVLRFQLVPLLFAYLLWLAISSSFSPFVSTQNILRVIVFLSSKLFLIIAIIIGFKVNFPNSLQSACRWFIAGVLFSTLMFLMQGLNPIPVVNRQGELEVINSKLVGQYLSFVILMLIFLPVYRSIVIRYMLLIFSVGVLVISLMKSSIIATLVGITLGWLFSRRNSFAIFLSIIIGCLVGVFWGVIEEIQVYLESPTAHTLTGRLFIWNFLLYLIKERPYLGYGYGVMKEVMYDLFPFQTFGFQFMITQAHNAFLDSLFSGGYIGLFIFSLVVIKATSVIFRNLQRSKDKDFASFVFSTLIVLLLRSITEASLHLGFDFYMLLLLALWADRMKHGTCLTKTQIL